MIEEPKTLTIAKNMVRPTREQIAAFQGVPTSFVVDAMYGDGALSTSIAPLNASDTQVAGSVLTCDNRPSDILATLAALNFVQAGDVVLSAAQGFQGCAAAGDRVAAMMKNAGAVGFVTDGPMRDFQGIIDTGLPCWCTGLNPGSPFATGPGRVGFEMQFGGKFVTTGDIAVADRDGVVIVPHAKIDDVITRLPVVSQLESDLDQNVREGLQVPDSILELLKSDQVEYL